MVGAPARGRGLPLPAVAWRGAWPFVFPMDGGAILNQIMGRASPKQRQAGPAPADSVWGIDPTGSDLHLGHSILFPKFAGVPGRRHTRVLIIGDFIRPQDRRSQRKSATRVQLGADAVDANAAPLPGPAGPRPAAEARAVGFPQTPGRLEVRRNSEWARGLGSGPKVLELLGTPPRWGRCWPKRSFANRYSSGTPIKPAQFFPLPAACGLTRLGGGCAPTWSWGYRPRKFHVAMGGAICSAISASDPSSGALLPNTCPGLMGCRR